FRQLDETPLLSAEQERELARRVAQGDVQARDHLVRANLRLVGRIARGYEGRGLDLADLIAEGNLGLFRAAEAFDPSVGTRLSTYALSRVNQAVRRALDNRARTIRVPAYVAQLLVQWHRATAALHEELGRPPTEEEVAGWMRLSARTLRLVKDALRTHNAAPPGERGEEGGGLGGRGGGGPQRAAGRGPGGGGGGGGSA